jgi:multidrug resistance efflux pump
MSTAGHARDISASDGAATSGRRPTVVMADRNPSTVTWVEQCLASTYDLQVTDRGDKALSSVQGGSAAVLIVGTQLADMDPAELVAAVRKLDAESPVRVPLFVADPDRAGSSWAAELEELYYVLSRQLSAADVRALIGSAITAPTAAPKPGPTSPREARQLQRILALARQFALQQDLSGAARVACTAVIDLSTAQRAYCWFFDRDSGMLWSETGPPGSEAETTAATLGITGFVARTAAAVSVARAADDPRYHRGLDDPEGTGSERIMAQPVVSPDGEVHAVLVAVRTGKRPEFSAADQARLAAFVQQAGPLIHNLALDTEAREIIEHRRPDNSLFRREALDAYAAHQTRGDVIRVSPTWVRLSYPLVLVLLLAAVVYVFVGTVHQYSTGPAVVRVSGRTDVTAKLAGAIVRIEVAPGDLVSKGQLLARYYDVEEAATFERSRREFEAQLRKRMLAPEDTGVGQLVRGLRERVDAAEAALRERQIRAPRAGTVSDLRIRPGQHVVPGDTVLSLITGAPHLSVVAFLPGADRPQLSPGRPLRLVLNNYRHAYQELVIDQVDKQVIGPTEARRYLGPQLADALPIAGPVVVVRARLPSPTFTADGNIYYYYDGMPATSEVRIRRERIIDMLVPGLEEL